MEELFSQRLERDKALKKGGSCLVENENKRDIEEKMQVQKQFQQKLQADIQQTVKHIQEIQNTELRLPQNRKWTEVRNHCWHVICLTLISFSAIFHG